MVKLPPIPLSPLFREPPGIFVIVTGGRDYTDRAALCSVLDEIHARSPIGRIIEGGAKGADTFAREWARSRGVDVHTFHANWQLDGLAAGPKRNEAMVRLGQADVAVAAPGGDGTADCVSRLRKTRVPLIMVTECLKS